MTDQPCPFWPPDPAYDAMIRDGVVATGMPGLLPQELAGWLLVHPESSSTRTLDWPVDSHAARAAHGQRGSGQGQPAASVGDPYIVCDADACNFDMEEALKPGSLLASGFIIGRKPRVPSHLNRRQLVKRLRARWA